MMDEKRAPRSADVVVVGAGLAGAAASLSAAEAGADVVLLEREGEPGGSTVLSSGLFAFADTDEQRRAGIHDSTEALVSDILTAGGGKNDTELVQAYATHQLETYRWLVAMGIRFGTIHSASGQATPRSHPTDAQRLVTILLSAAKDAGVRIVYRARVERLILESEEVRGVVVDVGSHRQQIAGGTTILCAGGFSMNPDMLERFAPQMRDARPVGGAGSQGEGILMGCKVGAGLRDLPYIKGTFGIHPFAPDHTGILAVYKGAIAVNVHGQRFVDESLPYKVIGDACLDQDGAGAYQLFDQVTMDKADRQVPIYNFEERVERGQALQADTLEGLLVALDLPVEVTMATVEAYNRSLCGGEPDAMGRSSLCSGVGVPTPIATPPFYGMPTTTVVLATYAGLTVDSRTRVLDVFGDPIPGLLAAGEVTGGFHGGGYVTGTSLGKSAVFGRRAGVEAAAASQRPGN